MGEKNRHNINSRLEKLHVTVYIRGRCLEHMSIYNKNLSVDCDVNRNPVAKRYIGEDMARQCCQLFLISRKCWTTLRDTCALVPLDNVSGCQDEAMLLKHLSSNLPHSSHKQLQFVATTIEYESVAKDKKSLVLQYIS